MTGTEVGTDRRSDAREVSVIAIGPADVGRLPSGEPVRQGALGPPEIDPVAGDQPADRVSPGRADPVLYSIEFGDVLGGDLAGDAVDVAEGEALHIGHHCKG